MVVTIDGPSGAGKTYITQLLAVKLNFSHVNSGILYRTVSMLMFNTGISEEDTASINHFLKNKRLIIDEKGIWLNDNYVEYVDMKSSQMDKYTSIVSGNRMLRDMINEGIHVYCIGKSCICEGRDAATEIFPNADLKIYITADLNERVQRICQVNREKGINQSFDETKQSVIDRDKRDQERNFNNNDTTYVVFDTTKYTMEQSVEQLSTLIKEKLSLYFRKR